MMQVALSGFLGSSFKRGADAEAHRRAVLFHQAERERERKQRKDDARNDSAEIGDLGGMAITAAQAKTFQIEINEYQTATVEALEQNRMVLDRAREKLAETLAQAYTLEDGRRVFKSEDGQRVIDEFGNEVQPDIVDPDEIPNHLPSAEQFLAERGTVLELEAERSGLLEFQDKLDEMDALLDSGEMTVRELDEVREHLRDSAPDAVRARLSGLEPQEISPSSLAPTQLSNQAAALDLDADLAAAVRPTAPVMGG